MTNKFSLSRSNNGNSGSNKGASSLSRNNNPGSSATIKLEPINKWSSL